MGGGEEPPMDELKNWMYEKIEINVAGNVLQSISPELSQNSKIEVSGNKVRDKSNQRIANGWGKVVRLRLWKRAVKWDCRGTRCIKEIL